MSKIYFISGPLKQKIGATTFTVTADSQPVYDGWGWGDYWGCNEWMQWHQALKAAHGAQQAATIWAQAWNQQDGTASPWNWCKYNNTFRNYLRAQGIDVDSIVSAIVMPVFDTLGNLIQDAGDTATNVGTGISNTGKIAKYLLPVLAIGAGALAINEFILKPNAGR